MRKVEQLKCTVSDQKWDWVSVRDPDDTISDRLFFGDIRAGDYRIDGDLLRSLSPSKDLCERDFGSDEMADFLDYYNWISTTVWNDIFYITDTSSTYFEDFENRDQYNATREQYKAEEGSLRVHYKGLERESYSTIAVVGKQQGNRIVEDDRIDSVTAFENVKNKEALIKQKRTYGGIGRILVMIPCIFLLIFGIRRIRERD